MAQERRSHRGGAIVISPHGCFGPGSRRSPRPRRSTPRYRLAVERGLRRPRRARSSRLRDPSRAPRPSTSASPASIAILATKALARVATTPTARAPRPAKNARRPTNRDHEGDSTVWVATKTWRYEPLWPSPSRRTRAPRLPRAPKGLASSAQNAASRERSPAPGNDIMALLFQEGTRYNTPGLGARPYGRF